jgi:transcriptional regulator with XRE-family HTH domain
MNERTVYEKYLENESFERIMAQEDFIMEVTENFCKVLNEEHISRSRLAILMGKTKGFISQVLNGGRNLTLRSLADLAFALGYTVSISLVKKEHKIKTDSSSFVLDWNKDRKKISATILNKADDYAECYPTIPRCAA